jgi:polyphosphate kinase
MRLSADTARLYAEFHFMTCREQTAESMGLVFNLEKRLVLMTAGVN